MTPELERAARAIYYLDPNPPRFFPSGIDQMTVSDANASARSVLQSLREPTPEMLQAARKTNNNDAADKWRAMVDAILR